jgi:RNA polymerase sigma factor (sigma-70 family)
MSPPLLRLQSDERLAALAADGSGPAFGELARRHRPALVRACRRILHPERAEDAAQQALLSAQVSLRKHGAPDSFRPWLNRIAVNAALKQVRDAPPEAPLDEDRVDGVEQPPEAQERSERMAAAIGAIASLPEGQRRALVLRELEGRSHAEIARRLGLTQGAVRQLIHRARNGVRTAISAVTPYGLLARLGGEHAADPRLAEAVAGGAGGAIAGKAVATVLVAGGLAGGLALAPMDSGRQAGAGDGKPQRGEDGTDSGSLATPGVAAASDDRDGRGEGRDRGRGGNEGPGGGDRSGPSGEGSDSGSSGPDSGTSGTSGSGSSGSGSGTSGSGTSGSDTSGSGTSGSSGSGSSGSGSTESGSGSSGSWDDLLD